MGRVTFGPVVMAWVASRKAIQSLRLRLRFGLRQRGSVFDAAFTQPCGLGWYRVALTALGVGVGPRLLWRPASQGGWRQWNPRMPQSARHEWATPASQISTDFSFAQSVGWSLYSRRHESTDVFGCFGGGCDGSGMGEWVC